MARKRNRGRPVFIYESAYKTADIEERKRQLEELLAEIILKSERDKLPSN
jgi:hypothetical protein